MMKKWIAMLTALIMLLSKAAATALADDGILRPGDRGEEVTRIQ